MGGRTRTVRMVGAALTAVVAALIGGAAPAGATVHSADQLGYLTFVSYEGSAFTCGVDVQVSRDDSAHTAHVYTYPFYSSGADSTPCVVDIPLDVTITYLDERNVSHSEHFDSYINFEADLDHVGSNVKVTTTADFADCDPTASARCDLTVTAAPK
jgi:hypothetical protein